jgi:hypothetical protein
MSSWLKSARDLTSDRGSLKLPLSRLLVIVIQFIPASGEKRGEYWFSGGESLGFFALERGILSLFVSPLSFYFCIGGELAFSDLGRFPD